MLCDNARQNCPDAALSLTRVASHEDSHVVDPHGGAVKTSVGASRGSNVKKKIREKKKVASFSETENGRVSDAMSILGSDRLVKRVYLWLVDERCK